MKKLLSILTLVVSFNVYAWDQQPITAQQIGNTTYFSNGVTAQQIGDTTYISPPPQQIKSYQPYDYSTPLFGR